MLPLISEVSGCSRVIRLRERERWKERLIHLPNKGVVDGNLVLSLSLPEKKCSPKGIDTIPIPIVLVYLRWGSKEQPTRSSKRAGPILALNCFRIQVHGPFIRGYAQGHLVVRIEPV